MTGIGIIEVAIGLIFIYSLLSIMATTLNTIIAHIFKTRARHLKRGLETLLSDPDIRDLFMRHPLINLVKNQPAQRSRWEVIFRFIPSFLRRGESASAMYSAQTVAQETASLTRVDWIDPAIFSKVITDILAEKAALTLYAPLSEVVEKVLIEPERARIEHLVGLLESGSFTLDEFQREIFKLGDPSHRDELQKAFDQVDARRKALNLNSNEGSRIIPILEGLRSVNEEGFRKAIKVLVSSARSLEEAQTQLESWFDQRMDHLSDLYKRTIIIFSLLIGLILALLINADTLQIARTLFDDPSVRSALVAAANQSVASGDLATLVPTATPTPSPTPDATADPGLNEGMSAQQATPTPETNPIEDATDAIIRVSQVVDLLLQLNLPIGWEFSPLEVDCFAEGDLQESRLLCDNTRNLWLLGPDNNPGWFGMLLRKIIGIALTTLAIAQGAPFWFDLLNRLVRGRSNTSS